MSTLTAHETLTTQHGRPTPITNPHAGLRALQHYERRLPKWRYELRRYILPVLRWETPYLARLQSTCRSNILDSYFASTAMLGTHYFFMGFLPILFWFGQPELAMALVHMLSLGVYLSGALKDLLCLPRPLSPPLQRISMSGTAALEYGFPSTHTTNAVSAALFTLHYICTSRDVLPPLAFNLLCVALFCYATSITIGRVYCGMHGFCDVICGAMLGAGITWLRIAYGQDFDSWIMGDGWIRPGFTVGVLALAVRFHPEPADNCPCFDDSVAFLGVVMGIELGTWHHSRKFRGLEDATPLLSQLFAYSNQNMLKSTIRLLGGIIVIFLWRALTKPFLLSCLPPIFRFIDTWGATLPRRYFLQARNYTKVPQLRKDDNVLPAASEIPSMLSSLRLPRKRRVSIGPQSEADAREYVANREQMRKDGRSTTSGKPKRSRRGATGRVDEIESSPVLKQHEKLPVNGAAIGERAIQDSTVTSSLRVNAPASSLLTPPPSDAGASSDSGREDERRDREMFSAVEKPRLRYDVEVITKLVVYAGIGWLAVEGNPLLFERLNLV